jgi:hypothetical protein
MQLLLNRTKHRMAGRLLLAAFNKSVWQGKQFEEVARKTGI